MRSVSDLDLERYLVLDLEPDAHSRVETALATDPILRAYVEERREAQRRFARERPRWRAVTAPPRAAPARRMLWSWWTSGPALAAAGACALFFVAVGSQTPATDAAGATVHTRGHTRGGLAVTATVRRDDVTFRLEPGVLLRAHDAIRLEVDVPRAGFCTVVGIDAKGSANTHYDGVAVARGRVLLPGSLVLDDAVGQETWLVVVDETPRAGAAIVEAWRRPSGIAAVFPHAIVGAVTFEKEAAP